MEGGVRVEARAEYKGQLLSSSRPLVVRGGGEQVAGVEARGNAGGVGGGGGRGW